MPIHDWTRVDARIFHDFHLTWISTLKRALNDGRLPPDYYALAARNWGGFGPDVITVHFQPTNSDAHAPVRSRIAIRDGSDHQMVATIAIVCPGNKASPQVLRSVVFNAAEMVNKGIHLLVVDLWPPSPHDPQGIHAEIWSELGEHDFQLPGDKPLTLAAYSSGSDKQAFIEPVAVGDDLPDMPLYLNPDRYIQVPLALSYANAWECVHRFWRDRLEPPDRP